MRLDLKHADWKKLTAKQRKAVCRTPERVTLGEPAVSDGNAVFDHPALSAADCKAVKALIRSYTRKRKAKPKE